MLRLPRLSNPLDALDADDRAMLVRIAIYSALVLWAALIVGLAIRIFLALI